MTTLSKPSAEKTRALRAAVASYMDHIGLHDNAEFMRAQPDDFTAWSAWAHQLVTVMDKKTFQKDLPPNIEGMMAYSKEKTAELTARNRREAESRHIFADSRKSWGQRPQSENVIDRRDKGRLPVEPSLLAQALAGAQELGERGQRGFGKIIAALMGESENATPQPRSREEAVRSLRDYSSEIFGGLPASTIDKHAWDAAGGPLAKSGDWFDRGEQLLRDAWLEANRKDQSTVGGDTGGSDPAHFPGGYPPMGDDPNDFDGDGMPDLLKGGATFAAGKSKARGRNAGDNLDVVGIPTKEGSAITAPVSGEVVFTGPFRSYDNVVIVRGEDGTHTVIVGMQSANVDVGDSVETGQPIGIASGKGAGVGAMRDGRKVDASGLASGLQAAGPDPVPGYDGSALAGDPVSPTSGLFGGPTASPDYADAGLRGAPMMPGVAPSADYADAVARGTTPNPSAMAKALTGDDVAMIDSVPADFDLDRAIKATQAELDAVNAQTAPALDRSYSSISLGGIPGDPENWGQGPVTAGSFPSLDTSAQALGPPMSDPRAAMHRDSLIDGDLAGPISTPAAPDFMGEFDRAYDTANKGLTDAWGGLQGLFGGSPTDAAASFERGFSPSWGGEDGGEPSKAAMRSTAAALAGSPGLAPSQMTTAFNHFGQFGDEAKYGMSDAQAATDTDPMTSFTRSMDQAPSMVAGEPMGESMGIGSFNGIGSPTAAQAEAQRGMPGLSMGAMSGAPSVGVPSQKADFYSPGVGAFKDALDRSIKAEKIGPGLKAAMAAALNSPSDLNSIALAKQSEKYGLMNGQPSKAVRALRAEQIANFATANPAIADAYGLSMGQQGPPSVQGGAFGDPFGGFAAGRGPMGPGFGAGGGYGGGPGQPSGPSISGPSGPSAGSIGAGHPGGQPSGPPGVSGPSGPGAGPGGSYGGGNPGGSPSPGGVVSGRGPGSNPGTGGGLSAGARAAIGAALSGAAAAASSDAARGFGGPVGPSFGGLGGGWF